MLAAQTQSAAAQQGVSLSGDLVGSAGMSMSPGAAQYNDWTFGRSYGQGSWLPRDPHNFQTGAFGPLSPIRPVTIDRPNEEEGQMRPDVRRWQYPVGWNLPIGMPGTEGLKLATFSNLRAYADLYSVARACIQLRKEEMLGLDFDIVPTDEAEKQTAQDREARRDFRDRRQKMLTFFERCDPNYQSFQSWFSALLEDVFVVDALSIFLHPTRLPGKGLFGSNLAALDLIDGTTIRPLLDIRGATPRPPAVAYQQYLWGVPRRDLMDVIMEQDEDELGEVAAEYRGDQLLYLPYLTRTWTPYGMPPIERSIIPITTGFRRQQYLLQYYTEGSIPGVFVMPGAASGIQTPEQIRALQSTLNAIAGDQAFKHKIIVLPTDSKVDELKKNAFDDHAENVIHEHVLMAFDVMPMELGLLPGGRSAGLGGKGVGEHTEQMTRRRAIVPFSNWLKRNLFDYIIHTVWRQYDLEWKWTGLEDDDESPDKDAAVVAKIQTGQLSVDEARLDEGLQPWGIAASSKPIFVAAKEVILLEQVGQIVSQATGQMDPAHDPSLSASEHRSQQLRVTQPVDTPADASASTDRLQDRRLQSQLSVPGNGTAAGKPLSPPAGEGKPGPGVAPGTPDPRASQPAKPGGPIATGRPKQVQAELKKLYNFLRHDRRADRFASTIITPEFAAQVAVDARRTGLKRAIRNAGKALTRQMHLRNREKAVGPIMTAAAREMATHATGAARGTTSLLAFIDQSKKVLEQAYLSAFRAGLRQYASDYQSSKNLDWHNPSHPTPRDLLQESAGQASADRAERAMDFLHGFAQDLAAGTDPAKLAGRINLYVGGVVASYEQGYASAYFGAHRTATKAAGDVFVTWNALGDCCDLCGERDGQQFTEADLPGYPGDGDFGDLCDGGPNCRCWLSYDGPGGDGGDGGGGGDTLGTLQTLVAKPDARPKVGDWNADTTATDPSAIGDWQLENIASDQSIGQEVWQANTADENAVALEDLPQLEQDVTDLADRANAQDAGSDGSDSQNVDAGQDPSSGDNPGDVSNPDSPNYDPSSDAYDPSMDYSVSGDYSAVARARRHKAAKQQERDAQVAIATGLPVCAGIAVRAGDTGRVLMLQRALSDDDPAAGDWEFPGGHLEQGEDAFAGAQREWQEETGITLPTGKATGTWVSTDGIYRGFVWQVEHESDVAINQTPDDRHVLNPDDPDGDCVEVVAWFYPWDALDMPALRSELCDLDWPALFPQLGATTG